jgi:hypothetical protein
MKKLEKTYISLARKALMHLAHKELGMTKTQVARVFNVDKSTAGRVLDAKLDVTTKALKVMNTLV